MSPHPPTVTRRQFIQALGKIGGAAAAYHGLATLGLMPTAVAQAAAGCSGIPDLNPQSGKGKSVVILGAGAAGLCSAYLFANSGFTVTLLEANTRYGGRSFTIRRGDRFHEQGGPEQVCRFTHDDLYFNAGPGRIPQHHGIVLEYCKRLNVPLEPYIFISQANRLQNDQVFDGKPVQIRQIQQNLQGHVAELLAKVTRQDKLDQPLHPIDRENFLEMLQNFGALQRKKNGDFSYQIPAADMTQGYSRAGYQVEPGAYLDHGRPFEDMSLQNIMASKFWTGDDSLFSSLNYFWQSSLMQPKGGMDMIWRGFCRALNLKPDDQVNLRQDVGNLVAWRGRRVEEVRNTTHLVEVHHRDEQGQDPQTVTADYCVSTLAPVQLVQVGRGFSNDFVNALADIAYDPACKVGWQTHNRFWETDDGIYGGISWTKDLISQIWYPSSDYQSNTGVLTAAYNRAEQAIEFGNLSLEQRFERAIKGGEKLHPGNYAKNIMRETALGIAWHHMPYFVGGWANDTFETRPNAYKTLNQLNPEHHIYLAGDYISYWPGWQEGSLTAANCAYHRILERV